MEKQVFLKVQIKVIQQYLKLHPGLDTNYLAMKWIDNNAAAFRQSWERAA